MIALACDHGALDLKKAIMAHLDKRGLAYKDFGCYTSWKEMTAFCSSSHA